MSLPPVRRAGFRAAVALAAVAFLLAGCGLFGKSEKKPPCPRVSILADTAQLAKFRPGEGRDLTDVEYEAEIVGFGGNCEFTDRGSTVETVLTVRIVAARGPALAGPSVTVPFFVAIADRNQRIIAKEVFDSPIAFAPGQRRVGVAEEVVQRIPIAAGWRSTDYEILLGLQLSAEQLDYNRRRRGF
jgi:hypothetical protein